MYEIQPEGDGYRLVFPDGSSIGNLKYGQKYEFRNDDGDLVTILLTK
jgi:hypothetical protein